MKLWSHLGWSPVKRVISNWEPIPQELGDGKCVYCDSTVTFDGRQVVLENGAEVEELRENDCCNDRAPTPPL